MDGEDALILTNRHVVDSDFDGKSDRPGQPGGEVKVLLLSGVPRAGRVVWLAVAAVLTMWAAMADRSGGIWGASRHALTVGFLAGMIFAIGPRILPSFCGGRQLFSPQLMLASCSLLNFGCLLRVASEIPAYEGMLHGAWRVLPVSAVVELMAVSLFALNLALTLAHAAVPVNDTSLYKISFATEHK